MGQNVSLRGVVHLLATAAVGNNCLGFVNGRFKRPR